MSGKRDPQVTSRIMSAIRSKGGKAETLLGKTMWSLGLRYRKHYPIVGKPDYVLLRSRIVIFCDGDFWHGRDFTQRVEKGRFKSNKDYWLKKIPRNMERDLRVTDTLQKEGWQVMRFWESNVLQDPNKCAMDVFVTHKARLAELATNSSHRDS